MSEVVLILPTDGTIRTLWNDLFPWTELGHCRVERASSVEFNNDIQKWEVILADGTYVGAWTSREEAIDEEVKYLNKRL